MKRLLPLLILILTLASCTSTSSSLRQMHNEDTEDLKELGFLQGMQTRKGFAEETDFMESQEKRLAKVRQYLAEEKVQTPEDFYHAAALLARSGEMADLVLAQECGATAAKGGEKRGSRVAAEAIDRYQMFIGKPQWYGTQVEFIEVLSKYRLYPVDPRTTDEQRKTMGLPPLAELRASVDRVNEKIRAGKSQ